MYDVNTRPGNVCNRPETSPETTCKAQYHISNNLTQDPANHKPHTTKDNNIARCGSACVILEKGKPCRPAMAYTLEKNMISQTYFIVTVVVTLCFNCPIGLIGMLCSVYSHSAFCRGDVTRGRCLARLALLLSLSGIVITISVVMSVVFYVTSESGSKYRL